MSSTPSHKQKQEKIDEKVLVVKKEEIFQGASIAGFKPMKNFVPFQNIIDLNKKFLWRSSMEGNSNYKQIIPYLVFRYRDKLFLMQRTSYASEQRLKNKYSLGIGGHIREEDMLSHDIIGWANREFNEEVIYKGNVMTKPLGIINDESSLVGRVHVGFVFLLTGDSDKIQVRAELKSGNLCTIDECQERYSNMELWSQLAFDFLKNNVMDT
jgi:predicted NUDIX family phosphoesterase